MLKRLILGLVKGLVIGGVVALIVVKGLGVATFGGALAYLCAIGTGVLAGLLAGKPVWARGARIEATLKVMVGAGLAAGVMFALRKWVGLSLDLSAMEAGSGLIGDLPAASLPLIGTVLAVLFDLDNTPGEPEPREAEAAAPSRARVAQEDSQLAAADEQHELEDEHAATRGPELRKH